jgi:H+/Cl- antiporter ClcA
MCIPIFLAHQAKYEHVNELLQSGEIAGAYFRFLIIQTSFAAFASICVWIEPVSAGSGIPEVKCFLNGIDIPRVGDPLTLVCKVLGVICSVCAGLPVGKEGPMVHSGSVVATTLSSSETRNDKEKRDFVTCGAAAGVCTAFSAPIGGILFALEEGASYWSPSLTWRTFFCSMSALFSLYLLNTIGTAFGKVGFNRLFSFGNFVYEGGESTFAIYECFLFILLGIIGGLIGAVFNSTNERITHWRIKHVNHSKVLRFVEAILVSMLVTTVTFALPFLWDSCTPLPQNPLFTEQQMSLISELEPFRCVPGKEYNQLASLIFTEAGVAIRQLFHLHHHAFSDQALILFFLTYISMAVLVYGIALPSGLFVPSLLSGAAFGRLFGNVTSKLGIPVAFSNTYALIGAAAVLGGMARMTISLTVILLECTGNEQFVLPLMLTLMFARMTGSLFNEDLYHIHIHLKKGVQFLEAELRSITRHHK